MEPRFRVRLDELLNDAHIPASLLRGLIPRLHTFLQPFLQTLLPTTHDLGGFKVHRTLPSRPRTRKSGKHPHQ